MAIITTNPSARDAFFVNLRAFVTTFIEDAQKRRLARITEDQLSSLNARELEDLGIARSEIKAIARQSVFGR